MDPDDDFWRRPGLIPRRGWPPSAYDAALPHGAPAVRPAANATSVDEQLADIQRDLRAVRQTFFKLTKGFEQAVGQVDPTLADVETALRTARDDVGSVRADVVGITDQFPTQIGYTAVAIIVCLALWICVIVLLYRIRVAWRVARGADGAALRRQRHGGYAPADGGGFWADGDKFVGNLSPKWKQNYVNFTGENLI